MTINHGAPTTIYHYTGHILTFAYGIINNRTRSVRVVDITNGLKGLSR